MLIEELFILYKQYLSFALVIPHEDDFLNPLKWNNINCFIKNTYFEC